MKRQSLKRMLRPVCVQVDLFTYWSVARNFATFLWSRRSISNAAAPCWTRRWRNWVTDFDFILVESSAETETGSVSE